MVHTPTHPEGRTIFISPAKSLLAKGVTFMSKTKKPTKSNTPINAESQEGNFGIVYLGQQAFVPSIAANPSLWEENPIIDERKEISCKHTEDSEVPITGNEYLVVHSDSLRDMFIYGTLTHMLFTLAPIRVFRKTDGCFYLLCTELDSDTFFAVAEYAKEYVMEKMGNMVPKAQDSDI